MVPCTFVAANRLEISRRVMEAIKISTRPGPGRPTRKDSAARREYLLCAGSRIICDQGYHGTSIRDIVEAVGMPKGSFYNYFDSKEDFVVEALEYYMRKRLGEFTAALSEPAASHRARLVKSFRGNGDKIDSNGFTPMTFLTKVLTEVGSSSSKIDETGRVLFKQFAEVLADSISEAQAAGEIGTHKDPEILAKFILMAWHGALINCRDREAEYHSDPFFEVLERDILV